jgi:hypothetical protein
MRIQNFDFPGNFLFPLTTCLLCLFVLLIDLLRTKTLCILILLTIDNWPEKSKVSSLMASIPAPRHLWRATILNSKIRWTAFSNTCARPHLSILTGSKRTKIWSGVCPRRHLLSPSSSFFIVVGVYHHHRHHRKQKQILFMVWKSSHIHHCQPVILQ